MADGCCTAPWEAGGWREICWENCSPSEATCSAASSALAAFRWEFTQKRHTQAVCLHLRLWTCWLMSTVLTHVSYLHVCNWGWFLLCIFRSQYKADLVKAFSHRVLPCFSDQAASVRPVIDRTFNLEDIADAHRLMEANKNTGKIVVNVIPQNQETQWRTDAVILTEM